jgi:isocitrate dehydrogenase (NAD+)
MARVRATLIRGDGIGPEIAEATIAAIAAAGGRVDWDEQPAGQGAWERFRDPLPAQTLASLEKHRLALKGPLATLSGEGFRSVNVALRQKFELYANVRPVRTIAGIPSRYRDVDLVVVRENTEDVYIGIEHYVDPRRSAAEAIAIMTRVGCQRIVRFALEYARRQGRRKVTLVHKANILKFTNGLFLEVGREIARERRFRSVEFEDMIVDAAAMKLVLAPERFDIIVTTNLFGDILSDLTAGLVGGLGLAPGANLGDDCAIFEAVHGTAPDIAGKGVANPSALMMAGAMLLDHVGQGAAAQTLRRGIHGALASPAERTRDVGGTADTRTFTQAVLGHMNAGRARPRRRA